MVSHPSCLQKRNEVGTKNKWTVFLEEGWFSPGQVTGLELNVSVIYASVPGLHNFYASTWILTFLLEISMKSLGPAEKRIGLEPAVDLILGLLG